LAEDYFATPALRAAPIRVASEALPRMKATFEAGSR
jgi:hypothetical protein